ncbi:hypothetical protein [Paenibacillus sp. FSL L8-0689]
MKGISAIGGCRFGYGIPGVLMAAFIGWILAKSMVETNGFFWR